MRRGFSVSILQVMRMQSIAWVLLLAASQTGLGVSEVYFYSAVPAVSEATDRGDGVYTAQLQCIFRSTKAGIRKWGTHTKLESIINMKWYRPDRNEAVYEVRRQSPWRDIGKDFRYTRGDGIMEEHQYYLNITDLWSTEEGRYCCLFYHEFDHSEEYEYSSENCTQLNITYKDTYKTHFKIYCDYPNVSYVAENYVILRGYRPALVRAEVRGFLPPQTRRYQQILTLYRDPFDSSDPIYTNKRGGRVVTRSFDFRVDPGHKEHYKALLEVPWTQAGKVIFWLHVSVLTEGYPIESWAVCNYYRYTGKCGSTPYICSGHGFCENVGVYGYRCKCDDGYAGYSCQTRLPQCKADSCSGNGVCGETPGGFKCTCFLEYIGLRCEKRKLAFLQRRYTSDCDWREVRSVMCLNGGRCRVITLKDNRRRLPLCSCPIDWVGQRCELMNIRGIEGITDNSRNYMRNCTEEDAVRTTCHNSGQCAILFVGHNRQRPLCHCRPGWIGNSCLLRDTVPGTGGTKDDAIGERTDAQASDGVPETWTVICGGVIGGVVFLTIIIAVAVYVRKKYKIYVRVASDDDKTKEEETKEKTTHEQRIKE